MRKTGLAILGILFFQMSLKAQSTKYIIRLSDKLKNGHSLKDPHTFLSPRAIERRYKQHIRIDESDLPVSTVYLDSIRSVKNVVILNQSKWLNQVCIQTTDIDALNQISKFSFVISAGAVEKRIPGLPATHRKKFIEESHQAYGSMSPKGVEDQLDYGFAQNQITIHNGDFLHNQGYQGQGMLIAVIDAGFYHYRSLPAFDSVNKKGQVVDTYDFVKNKVDVNEENAHGMQCFSVLAGNIPGKIVGSAPQADYLLYRSEDAEIEAPVEEQFWIAALERADSIGTEIVNTSLGYNIYDNPLFSYSYSQLNGKTSMMAKAATLAARKGMIVLVSAGNEGAKNWKYITTPADADSILSVGAVDKDRNIASFSSFGPTADGRIAPTVASLGAGTAISAQGGGIILGNGTSFSSPNLAGLVACLWQAYPDMSNMQIIDAIKKSSSRYSVPDVRMGYGIPDLKIAFEILWQQRQNRIKDLLNKKIIKVYPNPVQKQFTLAINQGNSDRANLTLYDIAGKKVFSEERNLSRNQYQEIPVRNLPWLPKGKYLLVFQSGNLRDSYPILIQ